MKKEIQIVMLPTEKASKIVFHKDTNSISYYERYRTVPPSYGFEQQHLYFLSDDKIEIGDWIMNIFNKSFFKVKSLLPKYFNLDYKKIIATTDENLRIESTIRNSDEFSLKYGGVISILPRPSNEFLKKYCKLGGMDKCYVEYEYPNICYGECGICDNTCNYTKLKVAPDNTITIYPFA